MCESAASMAGYLCEILWRSSAAILSSIISEINDREEAASSSLTASVMPMTLTEATI